jgi:uncharacterized protein YfaS (alpha-2-macroglobulin family)
VAVAVVDEAIFAVRPDLTPDLFTLFWGLRPNLVQTRASAPEEVSGGAYQRSSNQIAPVRERFLDTAHWDAHLVTTGATGEARVRFVFPGNLTSWRATALAVTDDTQVGKAVSNVAVSRPVMLRLGAPRLLVQGDQLAVTATVHNRTDRGARMMVTLSTETRQTDAAGILQPVRISQQIVQRIPAGGEKTVPWHLPPAALTGNNVVLNGTVYAMDVAEENRADFSDALRISVPVVPRGIATRVGAGAVLTGGAPTTLTLPLPSDRIEPATTVRLSVQAGLSQVARDAARAVLDDRPWGSRGAADQLLIAAEMLAVGRPAASVYPVNPKTIRDTLARLSRYQNGSGAWGWWENTPDDPVTTAHVVHALAALRDTKSALPPGVTYPESLLQRGVSGAQQLFNQTNLWSTAPCSRPPSPVPTPNAADRLWEKFSAAAWRTYHPMHG